MLAVEFSTIARMTTVLYPRSPSVYGAAAQSIQYLPMSRNPVSSLVPAAALTACSLQSEVLNSERIKTRFGSYGVEIIEQDGETRRSSLYSTSNGKRTCRTYAVVKFAGSDALDIFDVHQKVVAGASIGSTFKSDGWDIRKQTIYVGDVALPDVHHPIGKLMRLQSTTDLAVHAYQLHIEKGSKSLHYATIIEIHHPEYLDESELLELYSPSNLADAETILGIRQLVLDQH